MTELNVEKRKALRENKNIGASKGEEAGEVKERGDSPLMGEKRIEGPTWSSQENTRSPKVKKEEIED